MKLFKQQTNLKFWEYDVLSSKTSKPGIMRMGRQRLGCVFGTEFQNTFLQECNHIKIVGNILWCIQNIIITMEKGCINNLKFLRNLLAIIVDRDCSNYKEIKILNWIIYSNSPLKALAKNYHVKIRNREPLCPNEVQLSDMTNHFFRVLGHFRGKAN